MRSSDVATAGRYPGGKRFAFTIYDDTDVATVANVEPVYRLLESLGMRTTKTVWPFAYTGGPSSFSSSETLEDAACRDFVLDLQRRGFEIAFHGASMESSERSRTVAALERFKELFGAYPRVHANHSFNRENVYWGTARLDDPLLRLAYGRMNGAAPDYYQGHRPDSRWWWGDLCAEHVSYVRNLTYADMNLANVNPSMPYHDPSRPWVRLWFSAADAENAVEFNDLLAPANQERLEREGGYCIVATHLGKGFATNGTVHPVTRQRLEELARRDGWFCTTGELLDWLRERRGRDEHLPASEWRRMQWLWARDTAVRKWQARRRRRNR